MVKNHNIFVYDGKNWQKCLHFFLYHFLYVTLWGLYLPLLFCQDIGFVFIPVLAPGQSTDGCTRHMMAGMWGGQKERGRVLGRDEGGGDGRQGPQVETGSKHCIFSSSFLFSAPSLPNVAFHTLFSLCSLDILTHSFLRPNMSFLTTEQAVDWRALYSTNTLVAFLSCGHTHNRTCPLLHALTWRLLMYAPLSVALPFYCQQKMFNEFRPFFSR